MAYCHRWLRSPICQKPTHGAAFRRKVPNIKHQSLFPFKPTGSHLTPLSPFRTLPDKRPPAPIRKIRITCYYDYLREGNRRRFWTFCSWRNKKINKTRPQLHKPSLPHCAPFPRPLNETRVLWQVGRGSGTKQAVCLLPCFHFQMDAHNGGDASCVNEALPYFSRQETWKRERGKDREDNKWPYFACACVHFHFRPNRPNASPRHDGHFNDYVTWQSGVSRRRRRWRRTMTAQIQTRSKRGVCFALIMAYHTIPSGKGSVSLCRGDCWDWLTNFLRFIFPPEKVENAMDKVCWGWGTAAENWAWFIADGSSRWDKYLLFDDDDGDHSRAAARNFQTRWGHNSRGRSTSLALAGGLEQKFEPRRDSSFRDLNWVLFGVSFGGVLRGWVFNTTWWWGVISNYWHWKESETWQRKELWIHGINYKTNCDTVNKTLTGFQSIFLKNTQTVMNFQDFFFFKAWRRPHNVQSFVRNCYL